MAFFCLTLSLSQLHVISNMRMNLFIIQSWYFLIPEPVESYTAHLKNKIKILIIFEQLTERLSDIERPPFDQMISFY